MFETISLLVLVVAFGIIMIHYMVVPCGCKPELTISGLVILNVKNILKLIFTGEKKWLVRLRMLAFWLGAFSFALLFLTGFAPVVSGDRLHGYMLMLHASFAPVFIVCAMVVVLGGAAQYCFSSKDCELLSRPADYKGGLGGILTDTGIAAKACFWVLAIMTLPLTLSMVFSMLPLFGTEIQELLFEAHRWSALIFAAFAIFELYLLLRMQILSIE